MLPQLSSFLSRRLVDRGGGHRARVLQSFGAAAHFDLLSSVEQADWQNRELATLLRHAAARVRRYRNLLPDADTITPASARDLLAALPVMSRKEVQEDPDAFVADGTSGLRRDATGGSTGTPMNFFVDEAAQVAREASLFWSNSLAGWRYGEKVAMLWGSDRDVKKAGRSRRLDLRWRIENMRWFNAFDMDERSMESFHRAMQRFRPHLLVAYAGSAFHFARFLRARGWVPDYPRRAVVSSAEVLTAPMREEIEAVFGRPVFDRYGNREAGAIAAECSAHRGLHLHLHDFIVEVEGPDPRRVPGRLLITYLRNRAMPFIRYDTGDLAVLAPPEVCSCGRHSSRLARVIGRESDTIRTADGRLIHGEFFTHVLYGTKDVREFQFVQEDVRTYRLLLAADPAAVRKLEPAWKRKILDAIGPGAELTIEYRDQIPVLPSGKRKFTLSKVATQPEMPRHG